MNDIDPAAIPIADALIREFEGCRLDVYPDIGGLPTVGWGCRTALPLGATITQDEADQLLDDNIARIAQGVGAAVTVDLSPNQAAALICFAYNVGLTDFRGSTLLRLLNGGQYAIVPAQLMRWDRVQGQEVAGLERRRRAEGDLWEAA